MFANKQDQPGAKGAGEISEALRLGELRDRNWSIMACSAVDGSGVTEGMDWLVVSAPGEPRTQIVTVANASPISSKPSLRSKPLSSITEAAENLTVPTDDEHDFQHKKFHNTSYIQCERLLGTAIQQHEHQTSKADSVQPTKQIGRRDSRVFRSKEKSRIFQRKEYCIRLASWSFLSFVISENRED